MWDPISSATIDECGGGIGAVDIPIPGIDVNGDFYTDVAYFRASSASASSAFYFRNKAPSLPNQRTAAYGVSYTPWNWSKVREFAVADMTGDGKQEIMVLDPEAMQVIWLKSETNYVTPEGRSLPSHRAFLL